VKEQRTPEGGPLNAPNSHDHKKFDYALVTRDIRRLTALIHRADIDSGTRAMIDAALEQLEARVWVTLLHDPVTNTLINNQDEYSDGRPVTTTIGWGDGFATLVHRADPADGTSGSEAEELSDELWPY
jgi:hypothetical protein